MLPVKVVGTIPEQMVWVPEAVLLVMIGLTVTAMAALESTQAPEVKILLYQVEAVNEPALYPIKLLVPEAAANPVDELVLLLCHK